MKASKAIFSAIVALTTFVLTNHSALAFCDKKLAFADGYGLNKTKALFACTLKLHKKGKEKFGNNYTGLGAINSWCEKEGPEATDKTWVCLCSGIHCARYRYSLPAPQSFTRKPPGFGPKHPEFKPRHPGFKPRTGGLPPRPRR